MKQTDSRPVVTEFLSQCGNSRKNDTNKKIHIHKLGYDLPNEHKEGIEIENALADTGVLLS